MSKENKYAGETGSRQCYILSKLPESELSTSPPRLTLPAFMSLDRMKFSSFNSLPPYLRISERLFSMPPGFPTEKTLPLLSYRNPNLP